MEQGWDEVAEWERAKHHDGRAFASIFDHHESRVFRYSLRLTQSYHDAEDVTAAAFFELWQRREAVRLVADSTLPWLLVTATNISRNTRRALRRYRVVLDRLPRDDSRAQSDAAADAALLIEGDHRLWVVMQGLGRVDASLLMLTAVEGFPVKEAAAAVGLSEGAGRVRLHRTKHRLRGQLRPVGDRVQGLEGGNN